MFKTIRCISRFLPKCDSIDNNNARTFSLNLYLRNEASTLSEQKNIDTNQKINNEEHIKSEKYGSITIISLNRPEKRNAIDNNMARKLCDAITEFENDKTASVGVLHGVGGSFSSGFDMQELLTNKIKPERLFQREGAVGPTRRIIKKPMVCGVSGYCIANGLELALMCDLRVVEEDACLGFFNRRFGIPLIDGGTIRLPAMIGLSRALDLVLTGRFVSAKEALEIGIANRIVAPGTSLGQAVNLACSIAKFPQESLNHDRNALYMSAFETNSFDKACMNEIMSISKEVMNEMFKGAEQFNQGLGRKGKTSHIKEKTMADWELAEYQKEQDLKTENIGKDSVNDANKK